jgi:hypothetical protein
MSHSLKSGWLFNFIFERPITRMIFKYNALNEPAHFHSLDKEEVNQFGEFII